jgi:hypothetical protein
MNIGNLLLSNEFGLLGLEIFENCMDRTLCTDVSKKILAIESFAKKVNTDGINMHTLNGEFLIEQIPEIKVIHDKFYDILKTQILNLMSLDDIAVGISTNILRAEEGHTFRLHFDRHEYTVVIYLSDNNNFPFRIFPNIRTDPRTEVSQWLYDQKEVNPITVTPKVGKAVVFKGRTCLHGVELVRGVIKEQHRISLQFGFDTKYKNFYDEKYYGRKFRDPE